MKNLVLSWDEGSHYGETSIVKERKKWKKGQTLLIYARKSRPKAGDDKALSFKVFIVLELLSALKTIIKPF